MGRAGPERLAETTRPLVRYVAGPVSVRSYTGVVLTTKNHPVVTRRPTRMTRVAEGSRTLTLGLKGVASTHVGSVPRSLGVTTDLRVPIVLSLMKATYDGLHCRFTRGLVGVRVPRLLGKGVSRLLTVSKRATRTVKVSTNMRSILASTGHSRLGRLFRRGTSR